MPIKSTSRHDLESRYQAIIDNAVDGIITIDERGTIESVNPSALRMFGYDKEEVIGENIKILMPEPDRSNHDKYIGNYHATGKGKIIGKGREVIGRRKNGTMFPFLLSISEVILENKKIFTGIVHDISELREVKDALAKERDLSELKSRFVTMASHEFRTPLSTILSSVSLISRYNDPKDEEKRLKHVNRIKSSVNNLTGILNDFLSLSRLEEGHVMNDPIEFSINELCIEVIDEMNSILKEGQEIKVDAAEDIQKVFLDKNLVRNIMINLISNAIKYSDEGKLIFVRTYIENDVLTIEIKDQGIGIPEEDQDYLFSRFFRAHNAANIPGTGLGLNIVKKYLDLLRGRIEFQSKQSEGTTFTVQIPI
ncbi:MAG: PAS domain-containing sensor histidine kinase [Cytophaga sp.]|uniref:PAS domain-containing sensor histidine kinase n=1 Tax=Cytophaga sp. TaxID=29535 RepID=UPI003F7F6375